MELSKHYPRHVVCHDGATRIVSDHIQHSNLTGKKFGPDAKEIVEAPEPEPIVDQVAADTAAIEEAQGEAPAAPPKNKGGRPSKAVLEARAQAAAQPTGE